METFFISLSCTKWIGIDLPVCQVLGDCSLVHRMLPRASFLEFINPSIGYYKIRAISMYP
jgi:hypothetical protein